MSYKVTKNKDNEQFEVIELATEQVLYSSPDHDEAYEHYRFWKEGGAFGYGGWTPAFVLRPVELKDE